MATIAGAQQIVAGLKEAGIDLVASVPDINMLQLINLLYEDKAITHIPVGREEEGIGVAGGLVFGGDIDGYNSYAQRGNLPTVEDVCEGGMAMLPLIALP